MANYFDPLIDTVSLDVIEAAEKAMIEHVHHGAGSHDEPTMIHGARVLVQAAMAEAREVEQQRVKNEIDSLNRHYAELEKRLWQRHRDWQVSVDARVKYKVAAFDKVWDMLLTARRFKRKTVRFEDMAQAVGLELEGWR